MAQKMNDLTHDQAKQAIEEAMQRNATRHREALAAMRDKMTREKLNHECEMRRTREALEAQSAEQVAQWRDWYCENLETLRKQMSIQEQEFQFRFRTQKLLTAAALLFGAIIGMGVGALIMVV